LSKQDGVSDRFDRSDEYRIARAPDLTTVTPGAEVRYSCLHREGLPPLAAGGPSPTRDNVRWYKFRARALLEETRGRDPGWAVPVEQGPFAEFVWSCTWREPPGRYVIGSEISDGRQSTFCFLPQAVESAGLVLGSGFDDLFASGQAPSAADAEQRIARHLATLQAIERRFPLADPDDREKHQRAVGSWTKHQAALRGLLRPTDGKTRIALPALHLETATQARRPVLLFLCHVDDDVVGRARRKRPRWVLVDWTDPTDSRWHGTYQGVGDTAGEAIADALGTWDRGNRYPPGRLVYELPAPAFSRAQRAHLETDGKSLGDEIRGVFEWVAIGGLLVAGALLLFTPVPALAAGALGTSVFSSAAAGAISIGQRWRAGLFDLRQDAIDGLTILGALFAGAGAWARGARVLLRGSSGQTLTRVFIGAQIGADLVQGVLVAEESLREWDELVEDPELLPEERARKLLALFHKLAAAGLLTYLSLRGSAGELQALNDRPRHVPSQGSTRPSGEKLADLTDPTATVDTTRPPEVEGHTSERAHTTRLRTGVADAPKVLGPQETEFARFYSEEKHPWERRVIDRQQIILEDQRGFVFRANCEDGTLHITIITVVRPDSPPALRRFYPSSTRTLRSDVLKARELYPKMYEHFEQVGNPVRRLEGMWAWDNYEDARKVYDELISERGLSPGEAARIAVVHARTYVKYHRDRGFTRVVHAEHDRGHRVFHFLIEGGD
jgi:hypothetical protein